MATTLRPLDRASLGPPQNREAYINRPLPAPPTSKAKPKIQVQGRSRSSSRVSARRLSVFPAVESSANSSDHLSPAVPISTLRRPRSRSSLSDSPINRRTSKLQQLTGHKISLGNEYASSVKGLSPYASPVMLGDDSSSNYSQSLDDPIYEEGAQCLDCTVPNLVEDCCDDTCSKRSSGGPLSPHMPDDGSSAAPGTVEDALNEYFSETNEEDISDEYHQFTTNIAKVDKQRSRNSSPVPATSLATPPPTTGPIARSQSLTSRFSISARALFSRKRRSEIEGIPVTLDENSASLPPPPAQGHTHTHSHSHAHGHAHKHTHNHSHSHSHNHRHRHGRRSHDQASTPAPPPAQARPTSVPASAAPRTSRKSLSRASLLIRGSVSSGSTPPPTSVPTTCAPPTSVPPKSLPPKSIPPKSVPPKSVPPASLPPISVPSTSAPSEPRSERSESIDSPSLQSTTETAVETPTRSVFDDSDSDLEYDEETHMREVIREFFSPIRRSGDGDRSDIPRTIVSDDFTKSKVKSIVKLSNQERMSPNLRS